MTSEHDSTAKEHLGQLEQQLKEQRAIIERLWCQDCQLPYGGKLSDPDIRRLVKNGRIIIDPLPDMDDESVLGTCKLDLRLGAEALVLDATKLSHIEIGKPIPSEYFRKINLREEGVLHVHPNMVVVATTLEAVTLPSCIAGILVGKSSGARGGLSVEAASVFDAGWDGHPMLELHSFGGLPDSIRYGQRICAMVFEHLTSPTAVPYVQRQGVRYSRQNKAQL